MKVPQHHNYRAQVQLKTQDIWDTESRVNEIHQLRTWLDRLVEWEPDAYTLRIHSQGHRIDVWFEEERYALACTLRWA